MQILKGENSFDTSVMKALEEIDPEFQSYGGLLIVGSHSPQEVVENDFIFEQIREARENDRPTLGLCFGMQLMAIEYARNVLKIKDATSEEIGNGVFVVSRLPSLRVGQHSVEWDNKKTLESFWHRYGVSSKYARKAFHFSETDGFVNRMQLKDHPYFVGVQFHPEYQSSKENPHPVLKQFIESCSQKTN
jgi:CTP synthase